MRRAHRFVVIMMLVGFCLSSAQAQQARPFQYMVKFVCGFRGPAPPQEDQHVKPGNYATAINIYNHTSSGVRGTSRVALWYRAGSPPPGILPPSYFSVASLRVLEIDCLDVWMSANVPPGTFLKGMVHVGLDRRLEVAAVYTSQTHNDPQGGPDPGAGHSIDVEYIIPLVIPPAPPAPPAP